MALSYAVLEALQAPASVEALAQRLAVPAPYVRGELDRLARRGYVARVDGGSDDAVACSSVACAGCGFRAACGVAPEVLWARVSSPR
ncbi:MAG: MarR family transcriptional regulator [Trueperaceae bacterium]